MQGRLDDEDDIFDRFDESIAPSVNKSKASANFNIDGADRRNIEKVNLDDFEVNTFGRQAPDQVARQKYEANPTSPTQSEHYLTFKQSAKYNKFVQKEPRKPVVEYTATLDNRAKGVLKDDDLGEVGEWAGKTLNQKAVRDDSDVDSEEMHAQERKQKQEDDEFDFDANNERNNKPAESQQNTSPSNDSRTQNELIKQKIQAKLDGKGLKLGGSLGGGSLANRLANKQKELQIKKEDPSPQHSDETAAALQRPRVLPILPVDHGEQSPYSPASINGGDDDPDIVMQHGAMKLKTSSPSPPPIFQFRANGRQLSLGPNDFEEDDDWAEINKQNDQRLTANK